MILSRLGLNGLNYWLYVYFFIRFTAIVSIWHSSISSQKFIRRNCKLIFIYGNGSNSLMCSASHGEFRIHFFSSSAMNKCAIMLMTIIMTHMNNKQHKNYYKKKVFLYWWLSNVMSAVMRSVTVTLKIFIPYEIIISNYFGKKNFLCMRLLVD
jgi:hypothetical protein